jgi:hypothetical protein
MRRLSLGGPRVTGFAEMKAPSLSVGLLAHFTHQSGAVSAPGLRSHRLSRPNIHFSGIQRLLTSGGRTRVDYIPKSTDRSSGTRAVCSSWAPESGNALKERGRAMAQRKRCCPVGATRPQMVKDMLAQGLACAQMALEER